MKADVPTKIYKSVFGVTENHFMVNKTVKAVIINFGDERGDIVVENDNFCTRRKYADFTEGKKKAGLNPLQIVFGGIESAIACRDRYIGADDQIHTFGEGEGVLSGSAKMSKEYMDTLTSREIEAMKAAIYCAGEEATDEYLLHNIENDYISITTTRSGRDVAWYIDGDDHSGCVYVDTLEPLTEEEIERELC